MKEIITEEISKRVWNREKVAENIVSYEKIAKQGASQRQIAEELNVPRTTLQHWLKRKENLDGDKKIVEFFESPEGLAFLHQVVMAGQFVITQVGTGGIRLVCLFLELSGLCKYVASSYGRQQLVNVEMQKAIIEYSSQEKKRLSEGMKEKKITVCQDETFHPETCLVAIEPVSNFILVEKYDEKRDEVSWNKAMNKAVEGLKVEIIQSTSDEAKGILAHVNNGLGVHHSPDLFHIESELTKATSSSLSAQKRKAESLYLEASEKVSQRVEQSYQTQSGTNNLAYFEQRLNQAQEVKKQAQEELLKKQSNQKLAKDAIKAISDDYHPFALESGLKRSPQDVEAALVKHFSNIEQIAQHANLGALSSKRIEKARKLLPQMVATIAFFFQMVVNFVQEQSLSLELEEIIYQNLIPAYYLKEVSKKSKSAQQKKSLLDTSQSLMDLATSKSCAFTQLSIEQQLHIHHLAKESAQLFQRSSSCVEGRNGQLSLRHHSLHRLTNSKLSALTTVHNFFTKRDDGSTAADRFFGNKPKDLFLHLLDSIDLPARPASKRSFLSSS